MAEGAIWWWVRHGPTHQTAFTGWRDVPADLSDTGKVARLAAYLPADAVVISSDLIRSVQTADALQGTRRRLDHDAGLREFHFGDWDGRTFDDIATEYPEVSRAYWERPGHVRPPNGESWYDAAARVEPIVDRMDRELAGRNVIAVAHFGIILTQVERATGMAPDEVIGHRIDPLSVTRITYGGQASADPINHIP